MANMTKAPDFYQWHSSRSTPWSGWTPWYTGATVAAYLSHPTGLNWDQPAFRADMPLPSVAVSSAYIEMAFMNVWDHWTSAHLSSVGVRVRLYAGDVSDGGQELGAQDFTVTGDPATMTPVTHRFTFSGLSATVGALSWTVEVLDPGGEVDVSDVVTSTTYTAPSLSFTLAPSTVYANDFLTLTLSNRLAQEVTINFKYSDTLLDSVVIDDDQIIIECPSSWFDIAAFSGSSMRVNVSAADTMGRTASGSFTLIQPQGSAATPIAPRSTRLDGTEPINFAWSVSDTWGAQTGAQLQWSTDNAVWTDLASVSGSGTNWTAPALSFPAGTVYWRVRARNEYNVWGPWSSGVSWTVAYDAVSQVEPVDTPTSGVINASVDRRFSVVLTASGAVYAPFTVAAATLHWRSGTGGAWTDVAMVPDGSRASALIAAGTFPSGTVQWYAEATDNTGRTTETEVYTLSTLSAAVEAVPLSPINTVERGNGTIVFRWFYGSVDGLPQNAVQIATSADGETWTTLATVTDASARSYEAPVSTFSAGPVYWRARAKAEGGADYGPWSAVVSFVCYSAPVVAGVLVDSAPWATVTWQTEGQLAYEIEIDGVYYGPYFGAEVRSYTTREPLEDGLHTCHVRAQNKYGLWSEPAEANFVTQNSVAQADLKLSAQIDVDAALSWRGGSSAFAPKITVQPMNAASQAYTWVSFAVDASGGGVSYQWYKKESDEADWVSLGASGAQKVLWIYCNADMVGWKYRCVASNAAGSDTSEAASWTYGTPTAAPTITVQPETVYKDSGTVEFICGANGNAYQWYHKVIAAGGPYDIGASDGRTSWYLLYGDGSSGDLEASDGTDVWHMPMGSGSAGALALEDDFGNVWNLPTGSGAAEWIAMDGETDPVLNFAAAAFRDGEQFYCKVSNDAGYTDSAVAQFVFQEEQEPALPGDYYVYRDGDLIARRVDPMYTDRTALGEHSYRVLNRLENNMYLYSNTVTVTIAVDTLMIAPLEGGEWLRLCLSDRAERSFAYDYAGQVTYTRYCGMRYPEAEIGEGEDLTGNFDVCWTEEELESAKAFMALLRRPVVVKAPHAMVLEGVLQGFRRNDPLFYLRYDFTVRQMDWRELGDA